jgi:multiple sugar transport system permease protein
MKIAPAGELPAPMWYVLVGTAAAAWAAPVLLLVVASLEPEAFVLQAGSFAGLIPTDPSLDNYGDVFERVAFGRVLLNTLIINAGIVVGGLATNSVAAYALARLSWPGRGAVLALVMALLIVPFEAVAVPLFYGVTWIGWRDSYAVQILPFVANALGIYLFYSFFVDLPSETEEAAMIDGAGPWRIFLQIVVPQSKSVFATVAIVTFILHWGLYLWPLLVTTRVDVRPLPLAIATFRTLPPVQWGDLMAFAVMSVAPVVAVFIVLQRWFERSVASTGVKG